MEKRRVFSVVENTRGGDLHQLREILHKIKANKQHIGNLSDGNFDQGTDGIKDTDSKSRGVLQSSSNNKEEAK